MEKQELEVSQEMKDLMLEYRVCEQCKKDCLSSIFKTKKAIYYGMRGEKARSKFWKLARKLYPNEGRLSYDFDDEFISREDDEIKTVD